MFMAQALRGSSGAYHNQLMGLVGEILSLIRSSSRLHVFATRMPIFFLRPCLLIVQINSLRYLSWHPWQVVKEEAMEVEDI
jgi:hypothetical protein